MQIRQVNLGRKIYLLRPGERTVSPSGERMETPPTRIRRSAGRRDMVGSDRVTADTDVATSRVVFTLRDEGLDDLNTRWKIEARGKVYKITSISESPVGRREYIDIRAEEVEP